MMKHTTTRLIGACAVIFAMPLVSNAQEADPFGGGEGEKGKEAASSEDPFAAPGKNAPKGDDPFAPSPRAEEISDQKQPYTIEVTYEVFSLPMKEAAALHRAGIGDEELHKKMLAGVEAGTVKHEKVLIGRNLPGQALVVEQITEHIYNTEAIQPKQPDRVGPEKNVEAAEKADQEIPRQEEVGLNSGALPAQPASFDTRFVGDTLEAEATVDGNTKFIDLRLSVSHTSLIDYDFWGQGLSEVKMPRFAAPRFLTGITVTNGKTSYVGTVSPPKELQKESAGGISWLAFVTATLVVR